MNIGFSYGGHNFYLFRLIEAVFVFLFLASEGIYFRVPKSIVSGGFLGVFLFSIYRFFSGSFDPKTFNLILNGVFAVCFSQYLLRLSREKIGHLLHHITKCSMINDLLALTLYIIALKMGFSAFSMISLEINPDYFGYLRLAGLWGDPNYFALFATVFSVFNLYNISNSPRKIFRFAYLLNCITIVLTFSRSGWLLFCIMNTVSFLYFKKTRKVILVALLALSLTASLPSARAVITQRIESTYKTLGTSSSREVLWNKSLDKLFSVDSFSETGNFEKWAIGTGAGSQYFLLEKEYGGPKVAHNTYIDFLIEHGLIGTVFIIMPFLSLSYILILKKREVRITGILLLIVVGGMGMFLSFSASTLPFILYFLSFYLAKCQQKAITPCFSPNTRPRISRTTKTNPDEASI